MAERNGVRFLFLADTHLGFDYPVRPRVERRRRGEDFFENFRKVLANAKERRVDFVVHGGDFFFRSRVPRKIVDLAYKILFDFMEFRIPFFIVPGNHERARLPSSILLSHPGIRIFERPKTYTLSCPGAVVALSGFPFVRENVRGRFTDILEETEWRTAEADVKLLCLHQAVEGAQVGPRNYTFRSGEDVVGIRDIPDDFLAVLAGHIHRRQVLRKSRDTSSLPVIYPGATERTSFAEKSEEKGFYHIEIDSAGSDRWSIRRLDFIGLPARPMLDLFLDAEVKKDDLESFLLSRMKGLPPDAIVRLKADGRLDRRVASKLTGPYLRKLFPGTMNVELSSDIARLLKD